MLIIFFLKLIHILLALEYGRLVKHTFVDSIFGGYSISTVLCEECKHVSPQRKNGIPIKSSLVTININILKVHVKRYLEKKFL